jgi:hypothetical protein
MQPIILAKEINYYEKMEERRPCSHRLRRDSLRHSLGRRLPAQGFWARR